MADLRDPPRRHRPRHVAQRDLGVERRAFRRRQLRRLARRHGGEEGPQANVLIGHEAVANRTMLDLHRPLERGLLKEGSEKDVEAVRELLRHLLRLVGVSSNGKIDALERARGRRRPRRGAADEQAVPPQLDEGNRRQPDDRLRAVRRRVRTRRAAAHDDHRHRRRHHRLLRDEGPLSRPKRISGRSRSPATRSTRSC